MSSPIPIYNAMGYRSTSGAPADFGVGMKPITYGNGVSWTVGGGDDSPDWTAFDTYLESLDSSIPFMPDLETWWSEAHVTNSDVAVRARYRGYMKQWMDKLLAAKPAFTPKKDGSATPWGSYGAPIGTFPSTDTAANQQLFRSRQMQTTLEASSNIPAGLIESQGVICPSLYIQNSNRTTQTAFIRQGVKIAREMAGGRPVWGVIWFRYHDTQYDVSGQRKHYLTADDAAHYLQVWSEECDALIAWDWDGYGDALDFICSNYPVDCGNSNFAYNSAYPAKYMGDQWDWWKVLSNFVGNS